LYDPENNRIGIAIGDGVLMNQQKFEKLPYSPEFVFINCCFSGTMNAKDQAYYTGRYKLAANIGTQLIMMGVKAVVITGWAVDDNGAALFAEKFYELMLEGYQFGDAVRIARKACYQSDRSSNTWAAYQCYGDQFYTMRRGARKWGRKEDYVLNSQVRMALNNLYSDVSQSDEEHDWALEKLDEIIDRAEVNELIDSEVRELQAMIYGELGLLEKSYSTYQVLLATEDAEFSVKALEQYCSIRLKMLMANTDKDVKVLEKIVEDIEALKKIGETKSRLCLAGNANKFGVQITTGRKRRDFIKAMLVNYKLAYDLSKKKVSARSIHCLANFIIAGWIKSLQKNGATLKSQLDEYTSKSPAQFVSIMLEELKVHQYEIHTHEEMRVKIRLMMLQLLISTGSATKLKGMRKAIIDLYREMFALSLNDKKVRKEIAHVAFLLSCPELKGAKRENFEEILSYLKAKLD
jgi:hypothetical protein